MKKTSRIHSPIVSRPLRAAILLLSLTAGSGWPLGAEAQAQAQGGVPSALPAAASTASAASAALAASMASTAPQPQTLSEARAELLRQGWKPVETYGAFPDGLRWNQDGDAGALYKAGFKEVEACSSNRTHDCSFNYVRGVRCLTLHTQGPFEAGGPEPRVIRRGHVCPRAELMRPPAPALPASAG